jgi:tetratricopeptide (TPR) repeat protein
MICACVPFARAQSEGDDDPVKLFERGQDAHAKNEYQKAIDFYDAAIKLKPEFAEAEFQRAMALLLINRKQEALDGFKRTVTLRPDWAFAYSKFGTFLGSYANDYANAEPILRRAIELDSSDVESTVVLAEIRQRAGDSAEALKLVRAATALEKAKSWTWRKRSFIERSAGDKAAAVASLDKALLLEIRKIWAPDTIARFCDLRLVIAKEHSQTFRHSNKPAINSDLADAFELAQLYDRAGKQADALRILDALPENDQKAPEVVALRDEIAGGDGSSAAGRSALEQLLEREPKNAAVLARLGAAYRRVDPTKSQDYYYRALQLDPKKRQLRDRVCGRTQSEPSVRGSRAHPAGRAQSGSQ